MIRFLKRWAPISNVSTYDWDFILIGTRSKIKSSDIMRPISSHRKELFNDHVDMISFLMKENNTRVSHRVDSLVVDVSPRLDWLSGDVGQVTGQEQQVTRLDHPGEPRERRGIDHQCYKATKKLFLNKLTPY